MTLQQIYSDEKAVLENLFGADALTDDVWLRLNLIHEACDAFWQEQLESIPPGGVKYLLIAEAPPWSENGSVEYVYNPESRSHTFLKPILKAFQLTDRAGDTGRAEVLRSLTEKGFLLCDSLPFAMNYSNPKKRNRFDYKRLVSESADSYLWQKLSDPRVRWHKNLRIAFGVRLNALPLIQHFKGTIRVGDGEYRITDEMIAVNGANYPCAHGLARVFGLAPPS